VVVRSLLVWLVVILAETLHGIARTTLLAPHVGDFHARQLGVFTGSLMIFAITIAFVRWIGATTRRELFAVGVLWLLLTLSFEFLFGRFILHDSWERLLSDYDPTQGGFLAIGMVFLTLAPLMAAWIRGMELT
jgi:hypothetical protein